MIAAPLTLWRCRLTERLAPSINDPKQGVSQSDADQMMAHAKVYHCPDLMLLYPHHDELRCELGMTSRHRVVGSDDGFVTATFGLANLKKGLIQLRPLGSNQRSSVTNTVVAAGLRHLQV